MGRIGTHCNLARYNIVFRVICSCSNPRFSADCGILIRFLFQTLMKAALTAANKEPEKGDEDYEERKNTYKFNPNIERIINQLKGNTNIILSNGDLGEVKQILDEEVRGCAAKAGMIAPADVCIKPGPTGLDPKQTSFFQTLQIQTKIVKAQIDIVAEKQVITTGEKIT